MVLIAELYCVLLIFFLFTVPSQDQALQQVILLKKELAEMRANQALSEDKHIQSITSLDREVGRARGLMTSTNAEADIERSAHRETMEALDASENSVSQSEDLMNLLTPNFLHGLFYLRIWTPALFQIF